LDKALDLRKVLGGDFLRPGILQDVRLTAATLFLLGERLMFRPCRSLTWAVALVFAVVVAAAEEPNEPAEIPPAKIPPDDFQRLQGHWELVSLKIRHNVHIFPTAESREPWHLHIEGTHWRIHRGPDRNTTFRIDPTTSPKRMDRTFRFGENPQQPLITWLGIYQLEGDLLTFCHLSSETERPTEFATLPHTGTVFVWRKAAARPAPAVQPTVQPTPAVRPVPAIRPAPAVRVPGAVLAPPARCKSLPQPAH